jgi:Gas vesicle protein G
MNPLTFPFRLPLMPLKQVVRLGEVIQDEAEREMTDPARVRRELEELERRQAGGEISKDQAAELEKETVSRFTQVRKRGPASAEAASADAASADAASADATSADHDEE